MESNVSPDPNDANPEWAFVIAVWMFLAQSAWLKPQSQLEHYPF